MKTEENPIERESGIAPRPLSRLTYKILAVNVVTLAVFVMSFSYISQTRENLIRNEVENFGTEARIYSLILNKALSENHANIQKISQILSELNLHTDQQASLYSEKGQLIVTNGHIPQRKTYTEIHDKNLNILARFLAGLENWVSVNFKLPQFPGPERAFNEDLPKFEQTVDGLNIAAWSALDGGLILTAHINLLKNHEEIGALQLVRRDLQIEESFAKTRLDVFRFALISLVTTISFSLYLAGLIGHPLRNLATAAEAFRLSRGREIEIPDLSARNDEIGELSQAMREMTGALKKRLTAIEQFAADVAHELKNPLSSMKSALETLPKVKNEVDHRRLMDIIQHDLRRMDRLISDISQASRLDAELSRDILEPFDLRIILNSLIESKADLSLRRDGEKQGVIKCVGFEKPAIVVGQSGRLAQVFDNLISNALSFTHENGVVFVRIDSNADRVKVMIEDDGPGIPKNRLEKIFDRFYSERPATETFGMHSGLGLFIAKQIVESHGGDIYAENRQDHAGAVIGARFVVRLRSRIIS